MTTVLVRVFIAVKKHHDHGNSYKEKHLIGVAHLQFQRFSSLSSWWGTWWCEGRHGAGEVLHLPGNRKSTETLGSILSIGNLKTLPHSGTLPPTKSYPLQQSHTSYEIMGADCIQTTTEINDA